MDEQRLRAALREAPVPDAADARLRARAVVLGAHAARPAGRPRRAAALPLALATLTVLALAAGAALSGPAAVARWMGTTLRIAHEEVRARPHASLTDLPGGGRLLVTGDGAAWIAGAGTPRRAALPGDVAWSAFGRYLAQAHGRTLRAVDLDGRLRWRQEHAAPVHDPRWSPDGNRIAFRLGTTLQVTAGDGTGAHPVAAPGAAGALTIAAVAPAWRPGPGHVVAVALPDRRIALVDVDTGAVLRRVPAPARTVALSFALDGRLLAVGTRESRIVTPDGRVAWRARAATGRFVGGVLGPRGDQVALLRRDARGVQEAVLSDARGQAADRTLVAGRRLGAPLFSPDGRWLLVDWADHDSWLFFATGPEDRRVRQVSGVRRRFGGAATTVAGWCCARPAP